MEPQSLMLGAILMLVAPIGVLLYVAVVIAILVCRLLGWLRSSRPGGQEAPKSLR